MKGNLLAGLVTGLLLLGMGRMANATLLDFEEFAAKLISENMQTQVVSDNLQTQGYTITESVNSSQFQIMLASYQQGQFSGNGTTRLMACNDSMLSLTKDGGGLFNLLSFAGGESWIGSQGTHAWATGISVMGYNNGLAAAKTFVLDLTKDPVMGMQTFTLDGTFKGLSRVDFLGIGGNPSEFSLDNIEIEPFPPVPEPATLLLLGTGVAGLIGVRRKKKA